MNRTEQELERELVGRGLVAPRVTPGHVDACISGKAFHWFEGTTTTVCLLTLYNGFTVVGQSACASPENFNRQIGEDLAFADARRQIWGLEGFLLRDRLHKAEGGAPFPDYYRNQLEVDGELPAPTAPAPIPVTADGTVVEGSLHAVVEEPSYNDAPATAEQLMGQTATFGDEQQQAAPQAQQYDAINHPGDEATHDAALEDAAAAGDVEKSEDETQLS